MVSVWPLPGFGTQHTDSRTATTHRNINLGALICKLDESQFWVKDKLRNLCGMRWRDWRTVARRLFWCALPGGFAYDLFSYVFTFFFLLLEYDWTWNIYRFCCGFNDAIVTAVRCSRVDWVLILVWFWWENLHSGKFHYNVVVVAFFHYSSLKRLEKVLEAMQFMLVFLCILFLNVIPIIFRYKIWKHTTYHVTYAITSFFF